MTYTTLITFFFFKITVIINIAFPAQWFLSLANIPSEFNQINMKRKLLLIGNQILCKLESLLRSFRIQSTDSV